MFSLFTTFASVCKCVSTNLFGDVCSNGEGLEIYYILNMVINILTAGIGILAVIGIAYFGVQYLTAKDDPAQVKKAKSRLMAIIIGLAAYATIYAGLTFLLPSFTIESGSINNCTPADDPDNPHPVTPEPEPDTPDDDDDTDDDTDDDDSDDDTDDDDSDTGERSPYCGPEAPGKFGSLSSVTNKQYRDGSTVSDHTTKKYTTTFGRVYYVFKQANPVWKNARAGSQGDTLGNNGCLRTSTATVLRSFGANVTPADFAWAGGYSFTKADKYIKDNNLPVKRYELKKPYADNIWKVLKKHGAVIIWTEATSVFTERKHKLPIVDYKTGSNNSRLVYIADTTGKSSNNGWKDLDNYVIAKGNVKAAVAFEPTTTLNCGATGGGDSGDSGDSGTETPDINSIGKGDTCGPEGPARSAGVSLVSPYSSMDKSVYGKLTKKYTTTKNRVYYVYRQDDDPWKDASAGSSSKMKDEGESRTLIADIMRSFGAEVTPLHFSGSGISGKAAAISRAESLISKLSLPLVGGVTKYTSDYENKIKTTLNNGGAVLIKVKDGIFNHKSGATHVALIDIKEVSGKTKVFLVDSFGRTKASKDSSVPVNSWVDLDIVVNTSKTGIQEIHVFTPKASAITCPKANNVPIEYEQ